MPLTYLCKRKCYWIKTGILRHRILNDVRQMRQKIKVDRNQDGQRRTSVVGPLWTFEPAASQQLEVQLEHLMLDGADVLSLSLSQPGRTQMPVILQRRKIALSLKSGDTGLIRGLTSRRQGGREPVASQCN